MTSRPRDADRQHAPIELTAGDPLRLVTWWAVLGVILARLPFLTEAPTADEAGFMTVGAQWHRGDSLYGDHWVDRPPLLIGVHGLAAKLGGIVPLRIFGMVAAVAAVLLTVAIVRLVADRAVRPPRTILLVTPLVLVAAYGVTPLFGAHHADGELLALPLVLGGVWALLRALVAGFEGDRRRLVQWAVVAGVAATCAALMKQNIIDVFLVAAALALPILRTRGIGWRLAGWFAVGALGALGLALGLAALGGTYPGPLFDALVVFRAEAGSVIAEHASSANNVRLRLLLLAALGSLAPVIVGVLVWMVRGRLEPAHRGLPDLRLPAGVLMAWEVAAIIGGGSYWLHYLLLLIPALVLLCAASIQRERDPSSRWPTRALPVLLAGVLVSTVISLGTSYHREGAPSPHKDAVAWLQQHARPGDTGVMMYGSSQVLWDAELRSPYEHLWSLPIRVRDPHLTEFTRLLEDNPPTWLLTAGPSLTTWAVDSAAAQRVMDARYEKAATVEHIRIWRLKD